MAKSFQKFSKVLGTALGNIFEKRFDNILFYRNNTWKNTVSFSNIRHCVFLLSLKVLLANKLRAFRARACKITPYGYV